jgi:uncharacterized small protein (DUF1192 family)
MTHTITLLQEQLRNSGNRVSNHADHGQCNMTISRLRAEITRLEAELNMLSKSRGEVHVVSPKGGSVNTNISPKKT